MSDRFASAWRKVERAKEHIAELDAAITTFKGERPCTVAIKDHTEPGQRVTYVSHVEPWLPDRLERFSLLAGDAAHTLRSALDHFVCAAVPTCTAETAFPIWRKPRLPTTQDYRALLGRKVAGAPQPLLDALIALEPHQGGKGHDIWLLDCLDAIDKHRLLVTVAMTLRSVAYDVLAPLRHEGMIPATMPPWMIPWNVAEREVLKEGVELFIGPTYYFEPEHHLQVAFDIAFNEAGVIEAEPAAAALRHLVDEVEGLLKRLIPLA